MKKQPKFAKKIAKAQIKLSNLPLLLLFRLRMFQYKELIN